MSEEIEKSEEAPRRFNLWGFAVAIAFGVWSATFFAAPGYAQIEGFWQGIFYLLGLVCFLISSLGLFVSMLQWIGDSTENFLLLVYIVGSLFIAGGLHLATVYVGMSEALFTLLRIVAIVASLPGSFLLCLGFARVIDGLPAPSNRTDALLTFLAVLGALLPIIASLYGR